MNQRDFFFFLRMKTLQSLEGPGPKKKTLQLELVQGPRVQLRKRSHSCAGSSLSLCLSLHSQAGMHFRSQERPLPQRHCWHSGGLLWWAVPVKALDKEQELQNKTYSFIPIQPAPTRPGDWGETPPYLWRYEKRRTHSSRFPE